jgi:hypothetical protein
VARELAWAAAAFSLSASNAHCCNCIPCLNTVEFRQFRVADCQECSVPGAGVTGMSMTYDSSTHDPRQVAV